MANFVEQDTPHGYSTKMNVKMVHFTKVIAFDADNITK
ncbi:hypothetical protein VCHC46B1_2237 [Vibrio cholerae HC-46B1]|nr:hypothetical protein VIF_003484 [Vibrio cholerae TM 11079-80]EGR04657.1 hypothetical protein VCHE39_0416 [Vibrio cholerae HE39]EGR09664.1 hypothetical protein VCHE48_0497 [Vibrio cholerae HE48]EJH52824.1 hypothetical protein VCHC43B1_2315 [Vibrio cholerae HC-43B1]EJH60495.1 hypothetical protein VCHE45_2584 [Vibrio cholerae HE-45]EKG47406.1 hypothetical protein VCHC50A1_3175 [Vibrio cholerae HC-50A1]EKG58185.1 hypothetical protein VCHC56A1_3236 [Vibrio cholerae HC-56A1]EKG58242.1 hypotheti